MRRRVRARFSRSPAEPQWDIQAMSRGRRVGLVAGIAAAAVVVVAFGLSDEIRVQYHLYKLKSNPAE